MIVTDWVIAAAASLLAYWSVAAFTGKLFPVTHYMTPILAMSVIWSAGLYFSGMYTSIRFKRVSEVLFIIYQTAYIGFLGFSAFCYLMHIIDVSRAFVIVSFALTITLFVVEKLAIVYFFRHLRRKGFNYRHVLVVGTGPRAQALIKALDYNKDLGLSIIGLLDRERSKTGELVLGHPVIGTLDDLPRITREMVVDQVFFVVPRSWLTEMERPILYLELLGIRVDYAIDYFNLAFANAKQSEFFGVPFLSVDTTPDNLFPLAIKRLMDVVLSAAAIVILSPLFAVTALVIKLNSPGPVFFVQKRTSMNGRVFDLFKFRTMHVDAEARLEGLKHLNEMKGPVFKLTNDPRITGVGSFLRKTSIDELPQLWNVLRGDMSLVGPRPPLPAEVEKYDTWQRRRISMRPGITCLWQVGGRNRITDFDEWARLDLKYIDNWSLWLDVRILLKTVLVVLFGIGAK